MLGTEVDVIAGQRVGLRPSPRLQAELHAAPRPPPSDDARVLDAIRGMPDAPVAIVPEEIPLLLERAAGEGQPWSVCVKTERADPFVYRGPPAEHDCRLHRVPLSAWVAAMKMADALDAIAPADLSADELAAIAGKLSGLGRPAGELAELLWRGSRWKPKRPSVTYSDPGVAVQATGSWLRVMPRGALTYDVPMGQIYDLYPVSAGPATWLRLWGCFDDGVVKDVGPMAGASAAAVVPHLRAALGLPRPCEERTSMLDLTGAPLQRWIELVTTWPHVTGIKIVMPPDVPRPATGARVRLRGLFELPPGRFRVLQWTAA
jgi:hypothetical protein